jgi:hypothetical protein
MLWQHVVHAFAIVGNECIPIDQSAHSIRQRRNNHAAEAMPAQNHVVQAVLRQVAAY